MRPSGSSASVVGSVTLVTESTSWTVSAWTPAGSTSSLYSIAMTALTGTAVWPENGLTKAIWGASVSTSGPVWNVDWNGVTLRPERSSTPAIAIVIVVLAGSGCTGVTVTSESVGLKLRLAGTATNPGAVTATVAPLTVSGLIGSLKRTRMRAFVPRSTLPAGGVTAVTVGAVVSVAVPVENAKRN